MLEAARAVQGIGAAILFATSLALLADAFPSERAHSVQFHPEAGPGPHDAWPLLERWVEEVAYAEAA